MKKWFLITFWGDGIGNLDPDSSKEFVKFCSDDEIFDSENKMMTLTSVHKWSLFYQKVSTKETVLSRALESWFIRELKPTGEMVDRKELVEAAFTENSVKQFFETTTFLDAPIDRHSVSVRILNCCKSIELKTLRPLMSISRSNPPREYKLFYQKMAVRPMKELVNLFAKHGLTLPE